MPVAFLMEIVGGTCDQYEAVMRGVRRGDPYAPYPDGCIAHLAGPTEGGWRIVDVWESQDAAKNFYGAETYQSAVHERFPPTQPEQFGLHRLEVYRILRYSE